MAKLLFHFKVGKDIIDNDGNIQYRDMLYTSHVEDTNDEFQTLDNLYTDFYYDRKTNTNFTYEIYDSYKSDWDDLVDSLLLLEDFISIEDLINKYWDEMKTLKGAPDSLQEVYWQFEELGFQEFSGTHTILYSEE